jgi:UDP-N-acetylmuramate--alanine ligase
MKIENLHSVYFMGIGGIGMSAIARWFNHLGIPVYGYDRTETPLTLQLEKEGMAITYVDEVDEIPDGVKLYADQTLIVWTPAIPHDSRQLVYFNTEGFTLQKRSEVLGIITRSMYTVAVAGTHGKTTTSSMIAHLLKSAGKNIVAFLGGVTQNYESNLILHDEQGKEKPIVVVEADEFDRSFLRLHPNIGIVTSVDPDHLDIYGDAQQLKEGFEQFIGLIDREGQLIIQKNAQEKLDRKSFGQLSSTAYGINAGDISADKVKAGIASFEFDFVSASNEFAGLILNVPGFHNVENALAAIAVALHFGVSEQDIRKGLLSYRGVKRRFEIIHQDENKVYIDDYAHHPEEIRAFLSSVKAMYPHQKLTAVFQPHLYTRTRDFATGFSESLSIADEVVLLDIYPAREAPIPGVEAEMLLENITSAKKSVQQKKSLLEYLEISKPEVLVTLGAGDIDRLVIPISKWIKKNGD